MLSNNATVYRLASLLPYEVKEKSANIEQLRAMVGYYAEQVYLVQANTRNANVHAAEQEFINFFRYKHNFHSDSQMSGNFNILGVGAAGNVPAGAFFPTVTEMFMKGIFFRFFRFCISFTSVTFIF